MGFDYTWAEGFCFSLLFFYFIFCFEYKFLYEPEESFWKKIFIEASMFPWAVLVDWQRNRDEKIARSSLYAFELNGLQNYWKNNLESFLMRNLVALLVSFWCMLLNLKFKGRITWRVVETVLFGAISNFSKDRTQNGG